MFQAEATICAKIRVCGGGMGGERIIECFNNEKVSDKLKRRGPKIMA